MTQISVFQESLARSIEQVINGETTGRYYLKLLAEKKANEVMFACKGKSYRSVELGGKATVITVGYHINFSADATDKRYPVIEIQIVLARHKDSFSNKNITDTERKKMNEIEGMIKYAETDWRKDRWYGYADYDLSSHQKAEDLCRELRGLKNEIKMGAKISWNFGWDDVLNEDFLKKGMNYDGQTIL